VPLSILALVVVVAAIVIGTAVLGGPGSDSGVRAPSTAVAQQWHLAWRSENAFPHRTSTTLTCRFAALLTTDGDYVRAEFTSPVVPGVGYVISSASMALSLGTGLNLRPGSTKPLTFGGKASVRVRPGAVILSDPVSMFVDDGTTVDITMTADAGDAATAQNAEEPAACTPGTIADAGNAAPSAFTTAVTPRWLESLLVAGPTRRSIVAFGDSITAGPTSPTHARWSDVLTRYGVAVANAGVGGGELTGRGMFGSVMGTTRVTALLAEPGVTDLVVLIGTNDISEGVSATRVLDALATVIAQANAKHVRVWVATILPRSGSIAMNNARHAVNDALRSSWLTSRGGKVIDTDMALRDPTNPERLLPAWDTGDHVHPNSSGELMLGLTVAEALGLH
jgi:lysophospholipase L1-like esterase